MTLAVRLAVICAVLFVGCESYPAQTHWVNGAWGKPKAIIVECIDGTQAIVGEPFCNGSCIPIECRRAADGGAR